MDIQARGAPGFREGHRVCGMVWEWTGLEKKSTAVRGSGFLLLRRCFAEHKVGTDDLKQGF